MHLSEIEILKNQLIGKDLFSAYNLVGATLPKTLINPDQVKLSQNIWQEHEKPLLDAYKVNINKTEFINLRNKVLLRKAKSNSSAPFVAKDQHIFQEVVKNSNSRVKKESEKTKSSNKLKKKTPKLIRISPNLTIRASQNTRSGVDHFTQSKLRRFWKDSISIDQFEKKFKLFGTHLISPGEVVGLLKRKGYQYNKNDLLTKEIVSLISKELYERYLDLKKDLNTKEKELERTRSAPPKTPYNYFKLILTR